MMNDHDLDLALERLVSEHKGRPAPATLYERVWAIPTTTPTPSRPFAWSRGSGFATLFRAAGLLAGAASIALAGGLLFSAAQPSPVPDPVVPATTASASPSASVMASLELLATINPTDAPEVVAQRDLLPDVQLDLEDYSPGVFRVVSDGVRELTPLPYERITIGRDGSIWAFSSESAVRLGHPETLHRPIIVPWLRVAPDGTVWVIGPEPGTNDIAVSSFADGTWRVHPLPGRPAEGEQGWALDVAGDGTVWVAWPDADGAGRSRVAGLGQDGWGQQVSAPTPIVSLMVSDDGGLWSPQDGLHLGGGPWEGFVDPLTSDADEHYSVGRDGAVWSIAMDGPDLVGLARFWEGTWEACPIDDVPEGFGWSARVAAAPDRSLWALYIDRSEGSLPANGIARFDCETWSFPLPGQDVTSWAGPDGFAGDGSAWVLARPQRPLGGRTSSDVWVPRLYVITPEAIVSDPSSPIEDP